MSFAQKGIEVRAFGGHWVAAQRANLQNRQEIAAAVSALMAAVPPEAVTGSVFWIRHFIHSYPSGFDVEVCLPVGEAYAGEVPVRYLPAYQVLAKTSQGAGAPLAETYQALFSVSDDHALISDEFCIEVLHDLDPQEGRIEVLMVLHPWQALFETHLGDVMGDVVQQTVVDGGDHIFLESTPEERFAWTKEAIGKLDQVSDDYQRYLVLSGCSHVFPQTQVAKLKDVYTLERQQGADLFGGVDAVLAFMQADPGWQQQTRREGRVVFSTKNPSDPQGYADATTAEERRRAYCFCPIIRDHLEEGMSSTFCYCSAGFERKQWETALGQPVRIDVVKSLLKGDDHCQFAIHLPEA